MVRVVYYCVYTEDDSMRGKTRAVNDYIEGMNKYGEKVLSYQELGIRKSKIDPDVVFVDFVITYEAAPEKEGL